MLQLSYKKILTHCPLPHFPLQEESKYSTLMDLSLQSDSGPFTANKGEESEKGIGY